MAFRILGLCLAGLSAAGSGCAPAIVTIDDLESGVMQTIAGTGTAGSAGDGAGSIDASLDEPLDVLVDGESLYVADAAAGRVRLVDLGTGIISTLADGSVGLDQPAGLALDRDGLLLVADPGSGSVYRVDSDGAVALAAGGGSTEVACTEGDSAALGAPRSVAVMADGSLLVSEQACHRVRRITDDDIVGYVGTGEPGFSGDDGPATDAQLQAGSGGDAVSLGMSLSPEDPPDQLYIADTENHVIREVGVFSRTIKTFAGSGEPGFRDGVPEVAQFNRPTHVFAGADHSLWVVDSGNHAIRYIDPLGTSVTTVAGTGEAGFNGDGLAPQETQLDSPTAVWVSDDGRVFIADAGNHRIRVYLPPPPIVQP